MSRFSGTLLISGSQSSVNGDILLMAGDSDSDQAMSDATSVVKRKGFQSGFSIIVIGDKGQVGSVSGILMTDAVAPPAAVPSRTAIAELAPSVDATAGPVPATAPKKAAKKKAARKKRKKTVSRKPKTPRKNSSKRAGKRTTAGKKSKRGK